MRGFLRVLGVRGGSWVTGGFAEDVAARGVEAGECHDGNFVAVGIGKPFAVGSGASACLESRAHFVAGNLGSVVVVA